VAQPRLTGGTLRGRVLANPVAAGVRPTSARVREALFSIVGQDLSELLVLDAFGGTGLLGLEAWSRGATVVVVERDPRVAAAIRANADAMGAALEVRGGDVLSLARDGRLGRFDLVFADPPYQDAPEPVVATLAPLTVGCLVLEVAHDTPTPPAGPGLAFDRRRTYGATALVVYRA
jgi:16S rRNA (guanine966-N2)-methyltransferase